MSPTSGHTDLVLLYTQPHTKSTGTCEPGFMRAAQLTPGVTLVKNKVFFDLWHHKWDMKHKADSLLCKKHTLSSLRLLFAVPAPAGFHPPHQKPPHNCPRRGELSARSPTDIPWLDLLGKNKNSSDMPQHTHSSSLTCRKDYGARAGNFLSCQGISLPLPVSRRHKAALRGCKQTGFLWSSHKHRCFYLKAENTGCYR